MNMHLEIELGADGIARFKCDRCDEWHPLSELVWEDEDGNEVPMPAIRVGYVAEAKS